MMKKAAKGVLTEDFLEVMAINRAKNRAICALLGGAPGEIADDAEDILESNVATRVEEPQPLGWSALLTLAQQKGIAADNAAFLVWMQTNVPSTLDLGPAGRKHLTREESLAAQRLLSVETIDVLQARARENAKEGRR